MRLNQIAKTGGKEYCAIVQPDNVSLNKASIIERCIRRMREEYEADKSLSSSTHLDALILNIEP
ncbi:MAG: hypothetical protein L3J57_13075 [Desulfuromusa sp.]|nr:hypothetical protein [Desulfuromusa sp.]